uniref:Putative glycosyltransferase n=1 Tax=Streptomyces sp. SANK 60405 TaxID=689687 RepID=D4QF27_9ACTN|nr:putative glycosyltransferase [Streptomyces sp. SANK 60405]
MDCTGHRVDWTSLGGIGLRARELAAEISRVADVVVFSPHSRPEELGAGIRLVTREADWADELRRSDLVYSFDSPSPERLAAVVDSGTPVIVENAPPLEHALYPSLVRDANREDAYRHTVEAYRTQLAAGTFFTCRSAVERATLVANLCVSGRVTVEAMQPSGTLDGLISTIPIGFSPSAATAARRELRRRVREKTFRVAWSGGLWTYLDPVFALDAARIARSRGVPVELEFLYGSEHADNAAVLSELLDAVEKRRCGDFVTLRRTPLGRAEYFRVLARTSALVCIGRRGVENDTCVRLRARDSRLFGLPTVLDRHGPTFDELSRDGLAHGADDPEEGADALEAIYRDRGDRAPADSYSYRRTAHDLCTWIEKGSWGR